MQKLGDKHFPPTVEAALRFQRIRLKSRPEGAALADEVAAARAELRAKRDAWDEAVDEDRAATAEVGYRDGQLDEAVKGELKAAVSGALASKTKKDRDALIAKLYGGKAPSQGMRPIGGHEQEHFVDSVLAQLAAEPAFSALKPQADKIGELREALRTAEADRMAKTTAERLARTALEEASGKAKRLYNQMALRLGLLFEDDAQFVESCFVDLRSVSSSDKESTPSGASEGGNEQA